MKKIDISNTITAYCFDELQDFDTFVYVIYAVNNCYIIDTFCGPNAMKYIIDDIKKTTSVKPIVINTHFHWDHIWGNCAFEDHTIISHQKCYKMIIDEWDNMISENEKFIMGNVRKTLPNLLFEKELHFQKDNIIIFYSPGHTIDSISILDTKTRYLFVGDNLEKPHVYIESPDIAKYIETLKYYIKLKPCKIFAGHTLEITIPDVYDTIEYLKRNM